MYIKFKCIYNKAYRKLYKFYLRYLFIYFTVLTIITYTYEHGLRYKKTLIINFQK